MLSDLGYMASNPDHPIARAVRAARAWSGQSRAQVAEAIGVKAATIGRWERGEWKDGPPRSSMLAAVGRTTRVSELADLIADILSDSPATQFAALARAELPQLRGPSDSDEADLHDVDDAEQG